MVCMVGTVIWMNAGVAYWVSVTPFHFLDPPLQYQQPCTTYHGAVHNADCITSFCKRLRNIRLLCNGRIQLEILDCIFVISFTITKESESYDCYWHGIDGVTSPFKWFSQCLVCPPHSSFISVILAALQELFVVLHRHRKNILLLGVSRIIRITVIVTMMAVSGSPLPSKAFPSL